MDSVASAPDTRRGQVGIGTLIVFIAMVLVAAIAAGVLVNTAGFLQMQAEDTGQESTEQVADSVTVITEVGEIANNDEIHEIRMGVQPAAGADAINLAQLTVQFVSSDNFTNFVVAEDEQLIDDADDANENTRATGESDPDNVNPQAWEGTPVKQRFGVDVLIAESEDDIVMSHKADRYELVFNTSGLQMDDDGLDQPGAPSDQGEFLGPVLAGTEIELTITNEVGAQTVAFMRVPDSLVGKSDGDTVIL